MLQEGLRVVIAEPKSGSTNEADIDLKRGSVVDVEQRNSVDEFMFPVRLDSGETQHWNLIKLFGEMRVFMGGFHQRCKKVIGAKLLYLF